MSDTVNEVHFSDVIKLKDKHFYISSLHISPPYKQCETIIVECDEDGIVEDIDTMGIKYHDSVESMVLMHINICRNPQNYIHKRKEK